MIPNVADMEREMLALEADMAKVMQQSRVIVKEAGKCIVTMHSGRMADAESMLGELGKKVRGLWEVDGGFGHYSLEAYQEYAEAYIVYTYLKEGRIAGRDEIGVGSRPYILGMLDAVGELKRRAFNLLRANRTDDAVRVCDVMQGIVDDTSSMRFPEGLLPGLRVKQDMARRHVGDLVEQLVSRRA